MILNVQHIAAELPYIFEKINIYIAMDWHRYILILWYIHIITSQFKRFKYDFRYLRNPYKN